MEVNKIDDNINNLFDNVKKMMDNGNIPPEIQQMMNNLKNSSPNSNTSQTTNSNNDINNILSQLSPEMINSLNFALGNSHNSSDNFSNNNQNGFNLDANTILKMKSIMEKMNNKNDPRANLLYSLKPYLRDSKKNKIDQYVNMLNISKIADFMSKNDNDKKTD